ncbi:integrase [Citrobacter sp. NCU1]|uniref:tyrosine-type recombinase/integrase n=1 Tax=Citrobacter sp. NCU1 TaxID=2026683 RepID=UPI001391761E|nr:tyrosine-type recombinase/integrase [Citrobacter sp. NCU1]NDO80922.1 integrase [Citrobacter sp. NCU1]
MVKKKLSPQHSLWLRGSTWHLHWNVPARLRKEPVFRGKAVYSVTLKTDDLRKAQRMRDSIISKFQAMADASAEQISRRAFMVAYDEASRAKEALDARLQYMEGKDAFDAVDGLESAFDAEREFKNGNLEKAEGYLAALHQRHELIAKYTMTLHEAAWEFIKENEGKYDKVIYSRVKLASASLLKYIGKKDVNLNSVTPRQVTRWISSIAATSSDGTRRSYISALNTMWQWAWLNEHVDGDSPFKGTKIEMSGDRTSYEDFTVEELQQIVAVSKQAELDLIRFGLVTGCRLGELLGLTPANFIIVEGVHAIKIIEGKTAAAARVIPPPAYLYDALKLCIESGTWKGKGVTTWSQRFSTLKRNAIGKGKDTKTFHSFRHMAATAYERAGIEERITAVLLGHKHKRGESIDPTRE